MVVGPRGTRKRQIFIIFSVDTEHDVVKYFKSKTLGWSNGVPILFDTFDALGMKGKVCWLIEYNIKDGIPANNPDSKFYVNEFDNLIVQIRNRGDELGIHPGMYDWLGGNSQISYTDSKQWDFDRSYKDPQFVMHVITSSAIEFKEATGVHPVACRTANHHYSTHLPFALEKNGICIDGSVAMKGMLLGKQHTAYYPDMVDIRIKSRIKAPILEFPSFPCGQFNLLDPLLRIRIECLLKQRQPIFLSLFTHNWNVLTEDGKKNDRYLENLASFMNFLYDHGAITISWPEAKRTFEAIQRL